MKLVSACTLLLAALVNQSEGFVAPKAAFAPKTSALSAATSSVTVEKTTHTLYYVDSLDEIDAGVPTSQEDIDAYKMTNNKGVSVTAMPRGANLCKLEMDGTNFVWENKEGAVHYGAGQDAFPIDRGLILNGGVRYAAVCAEHGLFYDYDWDMTTETSVPGEASIIFSVTDDEETRKKAAGPDNFSVGQFNRFDIPDGYITKYPVTNSIWTFKITLKDDEDFVRLSMSIDNPTNEAFNAEAWVPMTFPIDRDSEILSHQQTRWRRDEWWNCFIPNVVEWANVNTFSDNKEDDFNKPLSWPSSGIFYDFPCKQGLYHGCTINEKGKGIVYYAPEETPHYTKMWGWGNPDNFDRDDAVVNDPLAAGRPKTEYYEPWSSGFNFAFFQTTEFEAKTKYNWEVALVPIPKGLNGNLDKKLKVVDEYIAERSDQLSSVAEVTKQKL